MLPCKVVVNNYNYKSKVYRFSTFLTDVDVETWLIILRSWKYLCLKGDILLMLIFWYLAKQVRRQRQTKQNYNIIIIIITKLTVQTFHEDRRWRLEKCWIRDLIESISSIWRESWLSSSISSIPSSAISTLTKGGSKSNDILLLSFFRNMILAFQKIWEIDWRRHMW